MLTIHCEVSSYQEKMKNKQKTLKNGLISWKQTFQSKVYHFAQY